MPLGSCHPELELLLALLCPAGAESLKEGLALSACVRSVEDHGYLLALGVKVSCCAVCGKVGRRQAGAMWSVVVSAAFRAWH